ncbi:MAG TPA: GNAT family N-acetyltransferase [Candidatus Syntrophosphaera sp.]|nr:GNAT family N-acetyltransferase [Candidatus Syntrophosphaera sp.]
MMEIINVRDHRSGPESAARYIHGIWGRPQNLAFYLDAVLHSSLSGNALPSFYLMLDGERVAGCCALLTNDLISRQDLWPWLACLYVEPDYRGRALGATLLEHGAREAKRMGYGALYLTTDHDGYYEKYGWSRMEDGYNLFGERSRIYWLELN